MLVLSRKVGEKIMIGHDVELTVIRLKRGEVRLGFVAPPDKPIVRSELEPREGPADRGQRPGDEAA